MLFRDLVLAVASNSAVKKLITGLPAFRRMARRFVAGEDMEDALRAIGELRRQGLQTTLDVLGESVTDETMARQAAADYVTALDRVYAAGLASHVSVKLTQLGLDLGRELCLENMHAILRKAQSLGTFVRIDMEGSAYTERTLDVYKTLHAEFENVGIVIQAYLRRSLADIEALAATGAHVRLCKGAYREPPSVAFPKKADVDANYKRLLEVLFQPESLAAGTRVAVATHDANIIQWTRLYTLGHDIPAAAYEFQMLYGVRRDLQQQLAAQGHTVRVYVPFGTYWYPYFTRRLAERPANLLFIARNLFRG